MGNRAALPANNGNWPNLIRLDPVETNAVVQGQSASVKFFYQWAQPNTTNATVSFYIDDDFNPLNTNQKLLKQMSAPGNGASSVSYATVSLTLDSTNATPGYHATLCQASRAAAETRYSCMRPNWSRSFPSGSRRHWTSRGWPRRSSALG